ncbi:MAG TPA: SRPBCC domain-containing protein [Flavobacteriales bacterium]|nr:SRPBCC domain-containing protein [Flavobacteriales bacterium]
MNQTSEKSIISSRIFHVSITRVYIAFEDPIQLAIWWGPEGFTNTIHEFDLQPGGKWILTMHGPEKGNYENSSVFTHVEPMKRVSWTRKSQPIFDMDILFEVISEQETRMTFCMHFPSASDCEKMKPYVVPKNEENFDRLERLLAS